MQKGEGMALNSTQHEPTAPAQEEHGALGGSMEHAAREGGHKAFSRTWQQVRADGDFACASLLAQGQNDGLSSTQMAKLLNISTQTILRWLRYYRFCIHYTKELPYMEVLNAWQYVQDPHDTSQPKSWHGEMTPKEAVCFDAIMAHVRDGTLPTKPAKNASRLTAERLTQAPDALKNLRKEVTTHYQPALQEKFATLKRLVNQPQATRSQILIADALLDYERTMTELLRLLTPKRTRRTRGGRTAQTPEQTPANLQEIIDVSE